MQVSILTCGHWTRTAFDADGAIELNLNHHTVYCNSGCGWQKTLRVVHIPDDETNELIPR